MLFELLWDCSLEYMLNLQHKMYSDSPKTPGSFPLQSSSQTYVLVLPFPKVLLSFMCRCQP